VVFERVTSTHPVSTFHAPFFQAQGSSRAPAGGGGIPNNTRHGSSGEIPSDFNPTPMVAFSDLEALKNVWTRDEGH